MVVVVLLLVRCTEVCFVVFSCVFCNWPGVLRCALLYSGVCSVTGQVY